MANVVKQSVVKTTIGLGDLVRDRVTGLAGVVSIYQEKLYASDKALVTPTILTDEMNIKSSVWFDVAQLELVDKNYRQRPIFVSGLNDLKSTVDKGTS